MIVKIKTNGILNFIKKHTAISLMILMIPFSGTTLINSNMLGITGFKLLNIIALAVFISWLLKGGEVVIFTNRLKARITVIFFIYILIFTLEFLRSYNNLDLLGFRFSADFYKYLNNSLGYFLSYLILPLLSTFVFIYIINHIRTVSNIDSVIELLIFSMFIFAFVTILLGIDGLISGDSRRLLRESFILNLGFHYNTVAAFFMMVIPLSFAKAQVNGKIWYILLAVLVLALLSCQSRGAIVGTAGGVLFYLYSLKKFSSSQIIILIILSALCFLLAEPLQRLFSIGLESGDISQISSGRVDAIWLPLLNELINDPIKLISGLGLFGLIVTDVYVNDPNFFQATIAHNAFVDLLVDCGLIIFTLFVLLMIYSMKKAISWFKYIDDPLYKGLISSIVAFLIGCLTGRQFYPRPENIFIFIIVALALVYVLIAQRELKNERQ
jgi:hypothetical protein